MLEMIRQFTFHKPRDIIQPTLWLFLSQACSMLPAILAYMAIYTLGQAFVPPYTLNVPAYHPCSPWRWVLCAAVYS